MKIDKVKLIAIVFGVIIIFLLATRNNNFQFDTSNETNVSNQNVNVQTKKNDKVENIVLNEDMKKAILEGQKVRSVDTPDPILKMREAGQRSLEKFKDVARIEFDFKDLGYYFTDLDLEQDRMIGTYGLSNGGRSLALLATDVSVDEKLVRRYLQDYGDELPSLRRKTVRWDKVSENIPAMKESGLNDAKIWRGASPDGLIHVAVFLQRQDKKGSYAFVYSTPSAHDLENDGFFDDLYAKIKAIPAQ